MITSSLSYRSINTSKTSTELWGWTPEGSGRGTWDIITSCFFTIFICTWTVIHPRIHTSRRFSMLHKAAQLVKALLAPEMVCVESVQEWVQAWKMVKKSAHATEDGLKLLHAFYIGMLGLRYRTPKGDRVMWPHQYIWLLDKGLVKWSDRASWGLSEEIICDKNKADGFVKLTALCQVSWFVLQCITRTAHNLPVAPLETMTLAYVFIVLITYSFWWMKPKDISTPSMVNLPPMSTNQQCFFESLAMENVYDNEGAAKKPSCWYVVSRDCKSEHTETEHITADVEIGAAPATDSSEQSGKGKDKAVITQLFVADHAEANKAAPQKSDARGGCVTIDTDSRDTAHTTTAATTKTKDDTTMSPALTDISSKNRVTIDKPKVTAEKHEAIKPKPIQKGQSDSWDDPLVICQWDRDLYLSPYWPLICLIGCAFGALHLMSWNSTFPTNAERWIWRVSALTSVATSIISMQWEKTSLRWDGPLTIVRVVSPFLYGFSRIVMMAEVLAALRAMPPGIYETYNIWNYWFHIL